MIRPTQAEKIAQVLERRIQDDSSPVLPPMRTLAQEYRVSLNTVHKAVARLKSLGMVEVYQGGKIRIQGRHSSAELEWRPKPTSREFIYQFVRDRICSGVYPIGKPLPKVAYLASSQNLSHHAVTASYRRLETENLARKEGRLWMAGPRPPKVEAEFLRQPVIVLLQSHEDFWIHTAQRPFFESFCRSFQAEMEAAGVQLMPALFSERGEAGGGLPAGQIAVFTLIRSLGTRYRGALILNAAKEVRDLEKWVQGLSRFNRPVIWFDRLKENPKFRTRSSQFTRCHSAEDRAVDQVVTFLTGLGHRHMAYAALSREKWAAYRGDLIRQVLRERVPGGELHLAEKDSRIFLEGPMPQRMAALKAVSESETVPAAVRKAIRLLAKLKDENGEKLPWKIRTAYSEDPWQGVAALLEEIEADPHRVPPLLELFPSYRNLPWLVMLYPLLRSILENPLITAIIAPNDFLGHKLNYCLKAMGIAVPQKISLISFDNQWFLQSLPVTTVDFGYSYLGFAAFHQIAQDIDLKVIDGNIPAQPRIMHRGSVAAPSKFYPDPVEISASRRESKQRR